MSQSTTKNWLSPNTKASDSLLPRADVYNWEDTSRTEFSYLLSDMRRAIAMNWPSSLLRYPIPYGVFVCMVLALRPSESPIQVKSIVRIASESFAKNKSRCHKLTITCKKKIKNWHIQESRGPRNHNGLLRGRNCDEMQRNRQGFGLLKRAVKIRAEQGTIT